MSHYIITFHTHFDALSFRRQAEKLGITAKLMPVPRAVSSSCGTCAAFETDLPEDQLILCDPEALYRVENEREFIEVYRGVE